MLLPMKSSSKTVCTGIPAELRRDLNASACFAMHSTFLDGAHHRCIEVGLTSATYTALHERGGAGPCSGTWVRARPGGAYMCALTQYPVALLALWLLTLALVNQRECECM